MKTIIFCLIVLSVTSFAQVENSNKNISPSIPVFYYDALNYRSNIPGKTRVDIYVEVPYHVIQFIRSTKGFSAAYSVTISFFDEDKKLVTEKAWNESVNSADFETTISKTSFYLSVRSFILDPKKYTIRCQVEDQDSKKNYVREDLFQVKDLNKSFAVSDLLLVSKEIFVNGEKKVIPNISRNVALQKEGLSVVYEIYSDTSNNVGLEYSIKDDKNESIYKFNETHTVNENSRQVTYTLQNEELSMGEYILSVTAKDESGNIVEASKGFFSRWVGVPNSIKDLDKAIDQMVYIAKDSEVDEIKDAPTKEQRMEKYLDFWKQKDPTPSTEENEVFEEYYRRVLYANEHFKHYSEGWRTDMGMIFITLGPPSNVERHPFEFDSKPYEVWDYYDINKRFIFVDQTGFGDYRLITPVYGNWWKYRQ